MVVALDSLYYCIGMLALGELLDEFSMNPDFGVQSGVHSIMQQM